MKPRHGLLLGLLVLAAGLGWWLLQPLTEEGTAPLLPERAGLPDKVRITGPDRDPVALERRGEQWWLTEPFTAPARAARITGLLRITRAESRARYTEEELAGQDVGLSPPRLTVTLDGLELALGRTEPVSRQRYVRIGDTVHLTETDVMPFAAQPVEALVTPHLLWPGQEVTAIRVPEAGGYGPLSLHKEGDAWRDDEGERVADARVAALLDAWHNRPARQVSRAEGTAGIGVTEIAVAGAAAPLQFEIIATDPALRLHRPDLGLTYTFAEPAPLLTLPAGE